MEAHAHQDSTVSTALAVMAIGGIAVAGSIMLSPYILPSIGIGGGQAAEEALTMLHTSSGIAGKLNAGLAAVPFIGSKLAEGGFFNTMATGIIGLGGVLLGDIVAQEENGETAIRWGKLIKYTALITSALIALPTALTALGSGLIFLSTLTEGVAFSNNVISWVNSTIGTMAGVDHSMLGMSGLAAALPHLITCGAALLPSALSVKLWSDDQKEEHQHYVALDTKGAPLPAYDRNHAMNEEEVALTERYNSATPAQRILLKKELLGRGYDPDIHSDGTLHLYKHGHTSMAR